MKDIIFKTINANQHLIAICFFPWYKKIQAKNKDIKDEP